MIALAVYGIAPAMGGGAMAARDWIAPLVYLAGAGLVLVRAVLVSRDRLAWALLAAGMAAYATGSLVYTFAGRPAVVGVPSLAHAGWMAFYPLVYATIVLLLRERMRALAVSLALDALIGGLTLATLVAAFAVDDIVAMDGVVRADALIALGYLSADILLFALLLWAAWIAGRGNRRMWHALAAGAGLLAAADVVFCLDTLLVSFDDSNQLRVMYPGAMLLLALAAWQPPAERRRVRADSLNVVALPVVCAALAMTLQAFDHELGLGEIAHLLTVLVLAAALARCVITYRQLRRLSEGRRFLRGFEDATIGMSVVSTDGRWLRVNRALCDLLGRTPQELVGRPTSEVLHPDDDVPSQQARRRAGEGPTRFEAERRFVAADGRIVETIAATVLVDEDGDLPYFFSQFQDVTERNRATRHNAALAVLGRLAIELPDAGMLVERALPEVATAVGACSCEIATAGEAPASAASLLVPLRRRDGTSGEVLVVQREGAVAEFDELDRRFLQAVADILTGALDRADAEAETRRRALHDPLTGLANRTFLAAHVEQELAAAPRSGGTVALLLLDVDRFKMVNDTLGHTTGDELLRQVAGRLRDQTRSGDLVARLGGDEFVVACRGIADEGQAAVLADRVVQAFGEPFLLGGRELILGASVGVAVAGEQARSAEALLRDADVAMYRAKDEGGGRHVLFDAALRAGLVQRLNLEIALRRAVEDKQLALHFQPVIDLTADALVGFEALVRWEHPEHGPVSPGDFIPIAEDTGLIVPLGEWVIDEACRQVATWNEGRAGEPLHVSVNLSARQLDMGLEATLRSALERHGVPAGSLIVEITEGLLVEGESAKQALTALRRLGVHIALDDFGTGYSSLGYVSDHPLDFVKLDRSLIADLGSAPHARGIVRAAVEMANALGLKVVAEGVEEQAQADAARELGCAFGQGWFFARPVPAEEAADLARRTAVAAGLRGRL